MDRSVDDDTLALLRDLYEWGAAKTVAVQKGFGRTRLQALRSHDIVRELKVHNTLVIVLGRRGREILGLSPSWITSKDAAQMHLTRRVARERLEEEGFQYIEAYDRVLRTFHAPSSPPHYLATSLHNGSRGYTSRSALRLLTTYRELLDTTNGTLILATRSAKRLKNLATKHPARLKLLEL